MTVDSLDESSYEQHTRSHYRDPAVARRYAHRQSLVRSPAEWLVGRLERWHVRRALRRLRLPAGPQILDSPAGSGKLQPLLIGMSAFYCAADVSPAMLSFGRPSATVVADAAQLPFRSGAFDATVCLRLLHRVPRTVLDAMLSEATRVSTEGVVFSYTGRARSGGLHRLIQRVTGRSGQRLLQLSPGEMAELTGTRGERMLRDRSISFGLTAERVAVVACATGDHA